MNRLPLSGLTLDAVQAEAIRAHLKHGAKSLLNPEMPVAEKLAALGEEFGEVCRALTYDEGGDPTKLVTELIQLANVALSWVESLEGVPDGALLDLVDETVHAWERHRAEARSTGDPVHDRLGGSSQPS